MDATWAKVRTGAAPAVAACVHVVVLVILVHRTCNCCRVLCRHALVAQGYFRKGMALQGLGYFGLARKALEQVLSARGVVVSHSQALFSFVSPRCHFRTEATICCLVPALQGKRLSPTSPEFQSALEVCSTWARCVRWGTVWVPTPISHYRGTDRGGGGGVVVATVCSH